MRRELTANSVCSRLYFTPKEVKFYTDNVLASVTNSISGCQPKKGIPPACLLDFLLHHKIVNLVNPHYTGVWLYISMFLNN